MKMNAEVKAKLTYWEGEGVPCYTRMGGYPLFYLDDGDNVLCPSCASDPEDCDDATLTAVDVNWEDEHLYCQACDCKVESAYERDF